MEILLAKNDRKHGTLVQKWPEKPISEGLIYKIYLGSISPDFSACLGKQYATYNVANANTKD